MTTPSSHLPVASETQAEAELSLCPCCGAEFAGNLCHGCTACGARRVGPPLAMPAHQLPRLGRATLTFTLGTMLLGVLLVATAIELLGNAEVSFGLWTIVAAAEGVAWRMKWTLLPAAILSTVIGMRFLWRERAAARRHASGNILPRIGGRRFTWAGAAMSACVACLALLLVGVTIPERLRQREIAREAGIQSLKYATHAALLRYQARFGTLPDSFEDLRQLPDEDSEIALVLANFTGEAYKPSSVQAVARAPRSRTAARRTTDSPSAPTARLRSVTYNTNANDALTSGLTFTNYDLVWFGEDKILGTTDDRVIRDGEFITLPQRRATPPDSYTMPRTIRAKRRERANSR